MTHLNENQKILCPTCQKETDDDNCCPDCTGIGLGAPKANSFTCVITKDGFTETLVYEGKTYIKRYKKDDSGWEGLDQSWEYETDLPDHLIQALDDRDEWDIMDALESEDTI